MRLGVLCSGDLGYLNLIRLEEKYKIEFVFTDSKSDDIIIFCNKKEIPVFIGNPRNGRAKKFLQYRCNYLISINYLFIIEEDIISMADKLSFNIHGSLLPKYRGRTPHVWAIINDENQAGITAHIIEKGCDTGHILEQKSVEISPDDTGNDILEKYKNLYFYIIEEVLKKSESNTLVKLPQDESKATYFGKRTPDDGQIYWDWSKRRIKNWIRAQANPYPGAFTKIEGQKIIIDKVVYSDLGFNQNDVNGLIIEDSPNIVVKTPNGCLEFLEIRGDKTLCKKGKIFRNE